MVIQLAYVRIVLCILVQEMNMEAFKCILYTHTKPLCTTITQKSTCTQGIKYT